MVDGVVGVKQSPDPDRFVDNEVVTNDQGQQVYRQKTAAHLVLGGEDVGTSNPIPTTVASNGGVEAFVRMDAPGVADPGLVVRQAGPTQTWLVTDGGTVSEAHPLPVTAHLHDALDREYDADNRLPVDIGTVSVQASFDSVVSVGNSRTAPLAANEVFKGEWEEVTDYASINVAIRTDAGTVMDGARAQFSVSGVDDDIVTEAVTTLGPMGGAAFFTVPPQARFFRIMYTNGPVAQTVLEAEITFHFNAVGQNQGPIGGPTDDRSNATITKATLHGRHPSGFWAALRSSIDGILDVAVTNVLRARGENTVFTGTLRAGAAQTASQTYVAGAGQTALLIEVPEGHSSSQVRLHGTFSAGSRVHFEGSADGTDDSWFSLNHRRNTGAGDNDESSVLDAAPFGGPSPVGAGNSNWRGSPGGVKWFRVRCGTFTPGDAIQVRVTMSTAGGPIFQQGPPPLPTDRFASGVVNTVGATVAVTTVGTSGYSVTASGQWTGKLLFEQTVDGTSWRATSAITVPGQFATMLVGTGQPNQLAGGRGGAAATRQVRVRADNDFAGTVTVSIRASAGTFATSLNAPVQIGGLYGAAQTNRFAVGTAAVRLDPAAPVERKSVEVLYQGLGAANNGVVYVGFTNAVSAGTGRALQPGEAWTLDLAPNTSLFAVASAAGQQVQVTELS